MCLLVSRSHAEEDEVEVYDFDHVYPGSEGGLFVAILYGALGTSCFRTSHSLLSESSKMVGQSFCSVTWKQYIISLLTSGYFCHQI